MKVLGYLSNSHHCGVSYIEDGKIKGCFTEERFSRIQTSKDLENHPLKSLEAIQNYFNIDINDDNIHIATTTPVALKPSFFDKNIYSFIGGLTFNLLHLNKKINVYPHHFCHALSTHFTSGFDEKYLNLVIDGSESNNVSFPCILTLENMRSHNFNFRNSNWTTAYSVEDNKFKKIYSSQGAPNSFIDQDWLCAFNPLASLWTIIMPFLGFKANKDEGKLMGLAARGSFNKKIYDFLKESFKYENLKFDLYATNTFYKRMEILKKTYDFNDINFRSDLAYVFQKLTEDLTLNYINDLQKKFPGHKKLSLSGGLFANVKLNQKINEYTSFDEIYIMPSMGDEGVALGAAMVHSYENGVQLENKRWDNVFLGIGYTQEEMDSFIDPTKFTVVDYNPTDVAKLLKEGKVVGTFQGRSEFGPRALGSRSIMVEPSKKETHDYINKKLNRHEVMPFAPIIMSEYISEICYAYKSLRSAEFMTLCYTVKDEWVDRIPAVINIYDNTARPQVVYKERNPHFHEILSEFNKITDIPVLMNTSFNSHGEPIINHPSHALDHLDKDSIDYLILGNKLLNKK